MATKFDSKKLKLEREKNGFTFLSLARAIHAIEPKASKTSVWQWETKGRQPSIRYVMAMCKIFNKEPDFFMKTSK